MRYALAVATLLVAAAVSNPNEANAAKLGKYAVTYEVQVEYWFFDTTAYYWSTVYETQDQQTAQWVYQYLLYCKNNGTLNQVVPNSYWRYIAVDVRLRKRYQYFYYNLSATK